MRALLLFGLSACGFTHGAAAGAPGEDAPSGGSDADAPVIDAAASPDDAAAQCPQLYGVTVATSNSHYRVITTTATFWVQNDVCNQAPGMTHVAVFDSAAEAAQIKMAIGSINTATTRYYVGAVQQPGAGGVAAGWVALTGGSVAPGVWGTFGTTPQPDDGADGMEGNHEEQLAVLDMGTTYMLDVTGRTAYGVVCECDGKSVDSTAAGYIQNDPNHP